MPLPLIDFAAESDPVAAVHESLSDVGFMQVKNIGLDKPLLDEVFAASAAFFAAGPAFKAKSRYLSAAENFGYQGLLEENLDPSQAADVKETFTMRNIAANPPALERWPSADFRDLMRAFYADALAAGHRLQRTIAQALGTPSDFFTKVHSGDAVTLRLLCYPPPDLAKLAPGQLGAGAHTDYGFLTLLFQDDVGGLQVQDKTGAWIDVPPEPSAIVVNSGDLLERWTNRTYRSTLHRVVPRATTRTRYSIAMFIDPDPDAEVSVLPSCMDDERPALFPSITAGAHLQAKLEASHKGRFDA
jgi:isopenicillin N synthase-like dioxygenase